ncbi:MAG TPA: hypothetical protein VFJ95_05875 [Gammaproteobacteria bacterium]|nr:hypothetical protein [Gammaproteobacteria bacterium]
MAEADAVTLVRATRADAPLLGNLLELYVHDLSGLFPWSSERMAVTATPSCR